MAFEARHPTDPVDLANPVNLMQCPANAANVSPVTPAVASPVAPIDGSPKTLTDMSPVTVADVFLAIVANASPMTVAVQSRESWYQELVLWQTHGLPSTMSTICTSRKPHGRISPSFCACCLWPRYVLSVLFANRTIGRAFGTLYRLSVCRLSVVCLSVCHLSVVCDVLYCDETVRTSKKLSEGVNKPGSKS